MYLAHVSSSRSRGVERRELSVDLFIGINTYSRGLRSSQVYGQGQVYSYTSPPYIFQRRVSSGRYIPTPGVVRTYFPSDHLTNPLFGTEDGR